MTGDDTSREPALIADGIALGIFMISAAAFTVLLEHPDAPLRTALADQPVMRRAIMGLAMGLTAAGLLQSRWGRRVGAHMNPAVSLALIRLGKARWREAARRSLAHVVGGTLGLALAALALAPWIAHPSVAFVVTRPGPAGPGAAFAAEAAISGVLFLAVQLAASAPRWQTSAGWIASFLVGFWILVEAPLSGMSMNPARTLASALLARDFTSLWIYMVAPPLGMLAAAEIVHRIGSREQAWTRSPITT